MLGLCSMDTFFERAMPLLWREGPSGSNNGACLLRKMFLAQRCVSMSRTDKKARSDGGRPPTYWVWVAGNVCKALMSPWSSALKARKTARKVRSRAFRRISRQKAAITGAGTLNGMFFFLFCRTTRGLRRGMLCIDVKDKAKSRRPQPKRWNGGTPAKHRKARMLGKSGG